MSEKKLYKVFMKTCQYSYGERYSVTERLLGTTYAVSAKKAINNICYREGVRYGVTHGSDGYMRRVTLKAVEL